MLKKQQKKLQKKKLIMLKNQQILKDLPVVVLFSLAFAPLISLIRAHILSFIDLDEALIERTMEACWDAIKL